MARTKNTFTSIAIIYNPNSTGPGKEMAEKLRDELQSKLPGQEVRLLATEHAGHGEKIAYDQAKSSARPLIISASGDGGYHEVVNGLVKAQDEGAKPVAGLLPAGNANDHFRNVHQDNVAQSVVKGDTQSIDLLKLTSTIGGKPFQRYAHSYIGFGLTPHAGKELNKTKLNHFNEIMIVVKVLFFLRPIRILVDGKNRIFDSLIFSNIQTMSKVLTLTDVAEPDDGKFEVTAFRRRSKLRLIGVLLRASITGFKGAQQVHEYSFTTGKPLLAQLDGEIYRLDGGAKVDITIAPKQLTCIV